jgi:pentatricopeptide repeat protein
MVQRGCERNVITYSSLISACEKAGRCEMALQLFERMHKEGCIPNVVTYNSLIAACSHGEGPRLPSLLCTQHQLWLSSRLLAEVSLSTCCCLQHDVRQTPRQFMMPTPCYAQLLQRSQVLLVSLRRWPLGEGEGVFQPDVTAGLSA